MAKKETKLEQYKADFMAKGVAEELAATLAAEKVANEEILEQAAKENANLQAKLEASQEEKKLNAKVITHEGSKYKVTIPSFTFEDEKYTQDDLDNNKALVAKLLKIGFGGLVKLEGK